MHRAIVLSFQMVILVVTFRATAKAKGDPDGRSLSLWVATMLMLTPVVWLHYMVVLIIPFSMIAVAATGRQIRVRVWRFAMFSYCLIVLATPLMSTLTFRKDILDWRVGTVAELGFLALLSAWIAAWRFATEPFSESSDREDRSRAAARS
jgi:hypothetical protein